MSERDLSELLSRVEGAEGADRDLDWTMAQAFDQDLAGRVLITYEGSKAACIANGLWPKRKGACWRDALFSVPHYTASLDAAVGLVEKMLPEMNVSVTRHSDGRGACEMWVWVSNLFDDTRALNEANGHESRHQNVGAATPALALIAALLKALIEGERTKAS